MQVGPYRAVIRAIMRSEPVTHPCCALVTSLAWQHHLHGPLPAQGHGEGRGSATYLPKELASAQHPPARRGWICRPPHCRDLGSSQERGVSPEPKILPPTQWKLAGTETTKLPRPVHAARVPGYVGRGLALVMLLGHL